MRFKSSAFEGDRIDPHMNQQLQAVLVHKNYCVLALIHKVSDHAIKRSHDFAIRRLNCKSIAHMLLCKGRIRYLFQRQYFSRNRRWNLHAQCCFIYRCLVSFRSYSLSYSP
ncbi:hypothetical protein D3C77_451580 [compost metagenome]